MARLQPGDRINCKIQSGKIVKPFDPHNDSKTFEIVAGDEYGYYVFIPNYFYIKSSFKADSSHITRLSIHKKFLNEHIIYVGDGWIDSIQSSMDGMTCDKCHNFCRMASANQDNGTFICFGCRNNPYR